MRESFKARSGFRHAKLFVAAMSLTIASNASATVITQAWYRMGEADPGAAAGNTSNDPTQDSSINNLDANRVNTPVYSSDTGAGGSLFSMDHERDDGDGFSRGVVTTATDNFGIEAWIKFESKPNTMVIAYNGDASFNGWGLFYYGTGLGQDNFGGLIGGVSFGPTAAASAVGVWTHVAMVRNAGTATLYINGVAAAADGAAPAAPGGTLKIGTQTGTESFDGLIDEVRIFTFNPGEFQVSDLLYPAVPEPSSLVMLLFGAIGLLAFRRKR